MRRYAVLMAVLGLSLSGCAYLPFFGNDNGPNYQDAKAMRPLDVPPDLIAQAPQPGLTIPGAAAQPAASTTPSVQPAATTTPLVASNTPSEDPAGFGVFHPRTAPGEKPVAEKTVHAEATLAGKGADVHLETTAGPDQVWAAVKAVLQKHKVAVERFDPEKGELVTGWRDFREGLAYILGNTVAPTFREKYTFTLTKGADGKETLTIRQERLYNDPNSTWKQRPADADHNRQLMEEIRKQLGSQVVMAELPAMQVTRYRDDQGPYLVLSLVPEKSVGAVETAVKGLGYPVASEGSGNWVLDVRKKKSAGFVGNIFGQVVNGIKGIWGGGERPEAVAVRVRLLQMVDNKGSVLETEPAAAGEKDGNRVAVEILDRLQSALSPEKLS